MHSPRPLWGGFLGAAIGLVVVALLWQLAIAPPDRLLLWGTVSLAALGGSFAVSHALAPGRRAFVAVVICASVGVAVALTGLPELARGGSLSGPCVVEVASEGGLVHRFDSSATSASSPWVLPLDQPLDWEYAVATRQPVTASATGLTVGGFDAVLMREVVPTGIGSTDSGTVHAGEQFSQFRTQSGYYPHGVHHVFVTVTAGDEQCVMRAYVSVPPEHPFDGMVLVTLWALTLGAVSWLAFDSIRFARSRTR
ncbi:MAG: hypothetical protein WDZ57_01280 [Demequina sp.]